MDMAMTSIASRGIFLIAACALMGGCLPRQPVAEAPVMTYAPPRNPGDQSYLNPGPMLSSGTPGYLRAANESQMRDSRLGDDLMPRIP
jgi:hypothetical protein